MDWVRLAVELTREAMKSTSAEAEEPPKDLGTALAKQFALVDHNIDMVVRMINAHNERLERALRRQRIWNLSLATAMVILVVVMIFLLRGGA